MRSTNICESGAVTALLVLLLSLGPSDSSDRFGNNTIRDVITTNVCFFCLV